MNDMDRLVAREFKLWNSETEERLMVYASLLTRWQGMMNLVAPSTLAAVWVRHMADSAQVAELLPNARIWLDIGSGAGFPGLVTAIKLFGCPGAMVHLVESDKRKCAFLREVSRETGAATIVHAARIEDALPCIKGPVDAISARALASVPVLMGYVEDFLLKGATAVFLKGQDVESELTGLTRDCRFAIDLVPSKTEARARIVIVRSAAAAMPWTA